MTRAEPNLLRTMSAPLRRYTEPTAPLSRLWFLHLRLTGGGRPGSRSGRRAATSADAGSGGTTARRDPAGDPAFPRAVTASGWPPPPGTNSGRPLRHCSVTTTRESARADGVSKAAPGEDNRVNAGYPGPLIDLSAGDEHLHQPSAGRVPSVHQVATGGEPANQRRRKGSASPSGPPCPAQNPGDRVPPPGPSEGT